MTNPVAAEYDHVKGAVIDKGDHFTGETGLTKVPGIGSAYKPFKDGWDAVDDIGKGDLEAAGKDVAGVASDTMSFAEEAAGAIVDPLNWLISKGLGFLEDVLFPLKEILELVTGDSEALNSSAEKFDGIANDLKQLANNIEQSATQGAAGWGGDAAPAAGKSIGSTKQSILDTAESAGHIATMLKISSMLMKAAYDIINGIIADVVEQLVITWLAAQAAAAFTFGGSEAAAAAATPGEIAIGVARATPKAGKVAEILQKVAKVIEKLMNFLKKSKIFKIAEKIAPEAKKAGTPISKVIAEGAKTNALKAVGLPDKTPENAFKWAKAGADFASTNYGTFEDGKSAAEYSTGPGSQAAAQQQDDQSSQPTSTPAPRAQNTPYSFPAEDPDQPPATYQT